MPTAKPLDKRYSAQHIRRMDMQDIVNGLSSAMRSTRANYHLTLGGLIDALEAARPDWIVVFDKGDSPEGFDSYRGYYEDLAIDYVSATPAILVKDLRQEAMEALGSTFTGYKGGEYVAARDTPLWRSSHGFASGVAIIGWRIDGNHLILETRQVD